MVNLIEETRREVTSLDEHQRFVRAQIHLEDALQQEPPHRHVRPRTAAALLSRPECADPHALGNIGPGDELPLHVFILLENTSLDSFYRVASFFGLTLFWTDLFLELLHSSRDKARRESKFPKILYVRVGLLLLLLGELTLVQLGVENDAGLTYQPSASLAWM